MAEKDTGTGARREGVEREQVAVPPGTPGSVRPDGVAFDIEAGEKLPGMPTGDQRPANENANVRETGEVPPGHQRVPENRPV